jgi:hypothetical protein
MYSQIAVAFAFAVSLTGCGRESHASLRKAQIQLINETADTLVAAKDETTADAVKPKLKTLAERWRDSEKRLGALPVPTPEQAAELQRAHGEDLQKANERLAGEVLRVAQLGNGPSAVQESGELLTSCARPAHELLRKQQIQTAKEAADFLATIRDKSAVESARPKLKQLGDRWRRLETCAETLPRLAPDQEIDLKRKYDDELNGVKLRVTGELFRIALVPGGADALKSVGDLKTR